MKKLENLSFRDKPREELIFPQIFEIENVFVKTYPTSHTPMSEMRFGGKSPSYKTGDSLRVELDVTDNYPPIKKIIYHGFANLEKGDFVRAYLEKYNVKKLEDSSGPILNGRHIEREYFFERDFEEQEVVHRIEKLDDLKNVLVTFESI